jgi:hypothetical protein
MKKMRYQKSALVLSVTQFRNYALRLILSDYLDSDVHIEWKRAKSVRPCRSRGIWGLAEDQITRFRQIRWSNQITRNPAVIGRYHCATRCNIETVLCVFI